MIVNEPKLCTSCYVFPCICGQQYDTLTSLQLNTLYKHLTDKLNNTKHARTLQDYLTAEELSQLPKRFTNILFEKNPTTSLSTLWATLKNKNLLWKSCLLLALTKYEKNTTKNYYDFVVKLMTNYVVMGNGYISQILLAAGTTDTINIPLILASASSIVNDETIDQDTRIYINNCIKIVTYKKSESILVLLTAMVGIVAYISGLQNDVQLIDSTDITTEDLMIYIDEGISTLIYESFTGDFGDLITT